MSRHIGQALRRLLCLALCLGQAAPLARAADLTDGLVVPKDVAGKGGGNEYVSGDLSHRVLMQVNLWGGVGKPGIHYVPVHTDLVTLLSYAGGPTENAMLDGVIIKRKVSTTDSATGEIAQKEEILHVNFNDFVNSGGSKQGLPAIQANDIVLVPQSKPWISQNTLAVVTVATSLLTIVATGLLIQQTLKK